MWLQSQACPSALPSPPTATATLSPSLWPHPEKHPVARLLGSFSSSALHLVLALQPTVPETLLPALLGPLLPQLCSCDLSSLSPQSSCFPTCPRPQTCSVSAVCSGSGCC